MQTHSRLHPSKKSSRYYILTELRKHTESIIQKYIANLPNDKSLLDYGCGAMPYKQLYTRYVKNYIGADFPENPDADCHLNNQGIIPLFDSTQDIVLSTQVLEHVEDTSLYLQECRRVLRTGGLLILSTHGFWKYHPHPKDYWRWTQKGLEKVLIEHQFEIIDCIKVLGLGASGLQLLQDSLLSFCTKKWHSLIIFITRKLQKWIDKYDKNLEDACVFLIVAKKK